MFTFLDLFAGIGGFRIALEKLGGKCIGFSEIDKEAIQTYKNNFCTDSEIEIGDITQISEVPKVDVIVGGVPCQSWSVAGKRQGFNDERGKLWFDTIRAVKSSKPRAFIFENVKGLAEPRHKESLLFIKKEFSKIGYSVHCQVLNAYDYGLPQNRERVFLVGIKKNTHCSFFFPKPLNETPKLYHALDDVKITKSHLNKKDFNPYEIFGKKIPFSRNRFQKINYLNDFFIFCDTRAGHSTIHSWDLVKIKKKEILICEILLKQRRKKIHGKNDGNSLSSSSLKAFIPTITKKDLQNLISKGILCKKEDGKFDFVNTKNSAGLKGVYRIFLPQSDIFSTLTATGTNDFVATCTIPQNQIKNYKKLFLDQIYMKKKFRPLMPKEAARLQGFPDHFKLHENSRIAMKQIGNAVPINVVFHIMKEIIEQEHQPILKSKSHQLSLSLQ